MKKAFLLLTFAGIFIYYANAQKIDKVNNFNRFADEKLNKYLDLNQIVTNKKTSVKSTVWEWDTILTYDTLGLFQRHIQTYDANGQILTYLKEDWLSNTWENSYKSASTYDVNGNKLTFISSKWLNNAWENLLKLTETYDIDGNNLTNLFENWQNNAWVNFNILQSYKKINNITS